MNANITTHTSDQIISTLFTGVLYIAEHTGDPGKTGINEVTVGQDASYVRKSATFVKSADGLIFQAKNQADVSFAAAAAGANYSVTHISVWTAVSGGNCRAVLPLAAVIPVVAGTINTYAINDIVIKGE